MPFGLGNGFGIEVELPLSELELELNCKNGIDPSSDVFCKYLCIVCIRRYMGAYFDFKYRIGLLPIVYNNHASFCIVYCILKGR